MTIPDDALERFPPQPYEEIRRLVRHGDIFLCQGRDPFSRLIQWSTKSAWSHVAVAFRVDAVDRVIVLESVQNIGVRAVSLSDFCSRDSTGVTPYPGRILMARHRKAADSEAVIKAMAGCAFDHLGARFAPDKIMAIAARIFAARVMGNRRTPKLLITPDQFICSEFVAKVLHTGGLKIPWDGLGFIAPADFALDPDIEAVAQLDVSKPPRRYRKAAGRTRSGDRGEAATTTKRRSVARPGASKARPRKKPA